MAGANKPDGKSNTQRVAFTRRDADRIARVVRTVEAGDKKGNALTFGHRQHRPRRCRRHLPHGTFHRLVER
jgi:hypothetical protein